MAWQFGWRGVASEPVRDEHIQTYLASNGRDVDHPAGDSLILLYTQAGHQAWRRSEWSKPSRSWISLSSLPGEARIKMEAGGAS